MKARSLMIQGTASDVGKSIITTAICRILSNLSLKVFPFKSQNMALNSYILNDGSEMGKAQVIQAEAARREPDYRMNPILLKPTGQAKSQVILKGKFTKEMSAKEYQLFKRKLKPLLSELFLEISSENDFVIIEGAGSPAEINLNENDIVNMGMANIADSPVILVADIDKGGVFSQIYGTLALLEEHDRKRVKGVIINKFRGDVKLLESGLTMIESLTNVPVIGVIPFLDTLIEAEDSLAISRLNTNYNPTKDIDIAVITLEKISNFSELNSLSIFKDVSLRFIKNRQQFGRPDLLVIPATENLDKNIVFLKEFKEVIDHSLKNGMRIICLGTGTAILAKNIKDNQGFVYHGLGLIPLNVIIQSYGDFIEFKASKEGLPLEGKIINRIKFLDKTEYEPFFRYKDYNDGYETNQILCTQIVDIFSNIEWTRDYLNKIRTIKNLAPMESPEMSYYDIKEEEYNKLAKHVEDNINMDMLFNILNLTKEEKL